MISIVKPCITKSMKSVCITPIGFYPHLLKTKFLILILAILMDTETTMPEEIN